MKPRPATLSATVAASARRLMPARILARLLAGLLLAALGPGEARAAEALRQQFILQGMAPIALTGPDLLAGDSGAQIVAVEPEETLRLLLNEGGRLLVDPLPLDAGRTSWTLGVTVQRGSGQRVELQLRMDPLPGRGSLFARGSNAARQSAYAFPRQERLPPTQSGAATRYRAIAAGGSHSCALLPDGIAQCWGADGDGQSGPITPGRMELRRWELPAITLMIPQKLTRIAAGDRHSCALDWSGAIWCWGDNRLQQSDPSALRSRVDQPAPVAGLPRAADLALGAAHGCLLTAEGAVFCWGSSRSGEAGLPPGTARPAMQALPIPLPQPARAILAGGRSSCARMPDSSAVCWGALPVEGPAVQERAAPVPLAGGAPLQALALGDGILCWAEKAAPTVVRCAATGPEPGLMPEPVTLPASVTELSARAGAVCALTQGRQAWCWGEDPHGRFLDQPGRSSRPMRLPGLWQSVALGGAHLLLLAAEPSP